MATSGRSLPQRNLSGNLDQEEINNTRNTVKRKCFNSLNFNNDKESFSQGIEDKYIKDIKKEYSSMDRDYSGNENRNQGNNSLSKAVPVPMKIPSFSASKRRWRLGLLILLFVVSMWVLSSFLVNAIFEDNSYRKPYLITYINTGVFVVYLIPYFFKSNRIYLSDLNSHGKNYWNNLGLPIVRRLSRKFSSSYTTLMSRSGFFSANNNNLTGNSILPTSNQNLNSENDSLLNSSLFDINNSNIISNSNNKQNGIPCKSRKSSSVSFTISPESSTQSLSDGISVDEQLPTNSASSIKHRSSIDSEACSDRLSSPVYIAENMRPFTFKETAKLSLQFSILWFVSNLFTNSCLSFTSVASATILSCTSGLWTLLLGGIVGIEQFSRLKLIAIIISLCGIFLVGKADENSDSQESTSHSIGSVLFGDSLALIGAICYAVYTTMLKFKIGHESRINMQLFFGCVGLFNIILVLPVIIVLHFTGIEKLEFPPSAFAWWMVILNALSTVVSDYLWVVAMLMTSPLIVTVGLSATIPLASLGDMILKGHYGSLLYYLGAGLICGSFFVLNQDEDYKEAEYVPPVDAPIPDSSLVHND